MLLSLDFHQLLQRPGVDKMTKEQKMPFLVRSEESWKVLLP